MKINKKARVFFITLLVIVTLVALSIMYTGYRAKLGEHERLMAGPIIGDVAFVADQGEMWSYYIDNVVKYSMYHSLFDITGGHTGICTHNGIPLVDSSCDLDYSSKILSNMKINLAKYLNRDYSRAFQFPGWFLLPGDIDPPEFPQNYALSYVDGVIYGMPYTSMEIGYGEKIKYYIKPSFSQRLPFDYADLEAVYDGLKNIETNCEVHSDYLDWSKCIKNEINGNQEFVLFDDFPEPIPLPAEFSYNYFKEEYSACINSIEENCTCTFSKKPFGSLALHGEDYFIGLNTPEATNPYSPVNEMGEITISLVDQDEIIISELTGFSNTLCNIHDEAKWRKAIKIRSQPQNPLNQQLWLWEKTAFFHVGNMPGLSAHWGHTNIPFPLRLVKYEDSLRQWACFATKPNDIAGIKQNLVDEGLLADLNSFQGDCTAETPIYVVGKLPVKIPYVEGKQVKFKEPIIMFVFKH